MDKVYNNDQNPAPKHSLKFTSEINSGERLQYLWSTFVRNHQVAKLKYVIR